MNPEMILEIVQELRMLPYFPNDEFVMIGLVRLVGSMCETEEQVRWLVSRMTSGLYSQWPGPQEMRACYCSKFRPKDGISTCSTVYETGIPSEKTQGLLAKPPMQYLPPVQIDPENLKESEPREKQPTGWSRPVSKADLDRCPQWLKDMYGYKG